VGVQGVNSGTVNLVYNVADCGGASSETATAVIKTSNSRSEQESPPALEHGFDGAVIADNCEKRISSTTMLAFYVDSSACKNIPVRPETNFARPEATCDFILSGAELAVSFSSFLLLRGPRRFRRHN
jgi:hypothetical protein